MNHTATDTSKRIILYCVAGCAAIIIMLFPFSFTIFQNGDNCGYMTLGMALAQGEGFADPAVPGSPHNLWWPAGFPLFIAAFIQCAGHNWYILKLTIYILLYFSLVIYALVIYRTENSFLKSLLILAACCVSSGIHLLSSYLYSETFFCACSLLFFAVWYAWQRSLSLVKILLLSIAAVYIASIRLIGLSLPVAFILWLVFFTKKEKPLKLFGSIPLVLLCVYLGVSLYVPSWRVGSLRAVLGLDTQFRSVVTDSYSYETVSTGTVSSVYSYKIINFLRGYGLTLVPQSILRTTYDHYTMNRWKALCMGIFTCVILAGWFASLRKYGLLNLYVLCYFCILFFYGPLYVRLIVPLIPFLLLYLYTGMETLFSYTFKNERAARGILIIVWSLVICDNVYVTFTDTHRSMPPQVYDSDYQDCIQWIVTFSRPYEVVVSDIHPYIYLLRGKYCLPYNYPRTINEFITYLDTYHVKYVLISPLAYDKNESFMGVVRKTYFQNRDRFKKEYGSAEDSGSYVLQYIP